jgi:hypothetical protein
MTSSTDTPGTTVEAKGTVTMPEGEQGTIAISVSWTNAADGHVYALGVSRLPGVKAGETKEWTVTADLPADAEDVKTVLGAVIEGAE